MLAEIERDYSDREELNNSSLAYTLPERSQIENLVNQYRVTDESSLDISLSRSRKMCSRCMIRKTKWIFHLKFEDYSGIIMPYRLCFKCIQDFPLVALQLRSEY